MMDYRIVRDAPGRQLPVNFYLEHQQCHRWIQKPAKCIRPPSVGYWRARLNHHAKIVIIAGSNGEDSLSPAGGRLHYFDAWRVRGEIDSTHTCITVVMRPKCISSRCDLQMAILLCH